MKHIYHREIDPTANDSLARIVQSIPSACRVLDVGTGDGALGRYLCGAGCHVDGITYSEDEAMLARNNYAHIAILDLEKTLPSLSLTGGIYDVVVCADILEHLRNPLEILRDLRSLLSKDGFVLLSIPNATYMGVIFELMGGRFSRTREGILDATHVCFYDRHSLSELINLAGFRIQAVSDVRKGLADSEFSLLDIQALPKHVLHYVESLPDADVYQFVWTLVASEHQGPALSRTLPSRPDFSISARFAAQIFWDFGTDFDESSCAYAWGVLHENPQTLNFSLSLTEKPKRLRIDFADRAGVFEFFSFNLIDADGCLLFKWQGDWFSSLQLNDCEILSTTGPNEGRLFRATGNDPWVSLPAEEKWISAVRAELTITAPQRYQDAALVWAEHRFRDTTQLLQAQLANITESLRLSLADHASTRQALTHALNERDKLAQIVHEMQSSSSWRITAGLRRLSAWLRRGK